MLPQASAMSPPDNSVETLAKIISQFLMPQVTQQVESVLQAHGLLKNQNGEEEPVQTLDLHLNHNDEEELLQPVNETSITHKATSFKEGSVMNLDDVSAVVASKITGKDLSSAPLLGTNSTSVGTDNQFGDYTRLSDNVNDAIKMLS